MLTIKGWVFQTPDGQYVRFQEYYRYGFRTVLARIGDINEATFFLAQVLERDYRHALRALGIDGKFVRVVRQTLTELEPQND